jgi:hypothetical protein
MHIDAIIATIWTIGIRDDSKKILEQMEGKRKEDGDDQVRHQWYW